MSREFANADRAHSDSLDVRINVRTSIAPRMNSVFAGHETPPGRAGRRPQGDGRPGRGLTDPQWRRLRVCARGRALTAASRTDTGGPASRSGPPTGVTVAV